MSLKTRKFKRVGLTGEVLVALHSNEITLEGSSISEGGMSVISPEYQFKPGQIVNVTITGNTIPSGISATGEVVNYLYKSGNNLFIKFLDISGTDVKKIRAYIESFNETQIHNISFEDLI
jgi:hypothetical protein